MEFNLNNNTQLKKMVRSSITTTTTTTTNSFLSNDDWLIYKILTRLPVKTLFRFKSVCKEWCSLIEKDENFIDSHLLTHSKTRSTCRIFIVIPVPLTNKEFCITADLFFQEDNVPIRAVVDSVREVDSTYYEMITKPVNGLFCSIDQSQLEEAIRICNISTRHVSKSFRSTLSDSEYDQHGNCCNAFEYSHESFYYGFGFDPATNEHKLVSVWRVDPDDYGGRSLICEVLTLGRQGSINSWRMINDVPPDELTDESVYVNGVIYWNTDGLQLGRWNHQMNTDESSPIYIVAFDVGKEKFRTITVPDWLLEEATYHFGRDLGYNGCVCLLEVSGRLAMLIRVNHSVFNMYIYEDNDDYKKEVEEVDINKASTSTSFSSKNNERWIEAKSITLPLSLEENYVEFHTFVGSDDKIIVTFNGKGEWCKKVGKKKCLSFYCFNWKKDSWTEFEVSEIPSRVPHICFNSSFITFTESLLPVNNQAALSSNIVAEDQLHSIF